MSKRIVFRALVVAGAVLGFAVPGESRPVRTLPVLPLPRPGPVNAAPEPPIDLSRAVPASTLAKLPPTAEQFRTLKGQIARDRPAVQSAEQKSETLVAEARALRQKLISTAAHIEDLERSQVTLDSRIAVLEAQYERLSASLERDRVPVTRLLAVLERLQHDLPPAMVMRPDDALAAVRGATLIGASLPMIYGNAAALARRIEVLQRTHTDLLVRRTEAAATAAALAAARTDLNVLLARKEQEASDAAGRYDALRTELEQAAAQASNLQALLVRIAQLRGAPSAREQEAGQDIVTVTAGGPDAHLRPGQLLVPVVGVEVPGEAGPAAVPGLTFATAPGAQVIAPADAKVLFAGPYHKVGRVLILEITRGYDVVLAGLGRVTVRPDDELLAGEPVGNMPLMDESTGDKQAVERLYFEIRQNGREIDPTPWLDLDLRKAKKT